MSLKNFYVFQNNINDQRVHIAFDKYSQKISYCCNAHFFKINTDFSGNQSSISPYV